MSQSGSSFTKIVPWSLVVLLSVFSVVGWVGWRHARKKLGECAARPSATDEILPAEDTDGDPGDGHRRSLEVRRPAMDPPADAPTTPDACLSRPDVQKEIRKQAAALAGDLSTQSVEDYKKDEQGKRLQRRQQFMENFEVASANAVNAYAREAELDEATTVKLHQRIEDGIKKQREMFAKVQSGELTEREAREQGHQLREEGRTAMVEMLGEQGSDRFFKVLGEEMRKEFMNQESGRRE
ncbi:MAG: hypothetical protein CVU65_14265 [Deltaproteobacteria bacterium HGW-Deltaproteobacteria-22]|jgi:hypothetical protein|nr:MAG: hypothetical protein CVU65_14265 [Deltaproteobacteria bacterium HGW-Deltaproteobacteria-22]